MGAEAVRIDRGDVFWLQPEGEAVRHPHVVVQEDVFNHSRIPTTIVCALTTNLQRAKEPGNVLLEPGEGGLARQSVIVVSQVLSVEKARLGERIGRVSPERVAEVLAGLRFLQAAFFAGR